MITIMLGKEADVTPRLLRNKFAGTKRVKYREIVTQSAVKGNDTVIEDYLTTLCGMMASCWLPLELLLSIYRVGAHSLPSPP